MCIWDTQLYNLYCTWMSDEYNASVFISVLSDFQKLKLGKYFFFFFSIWDWKRVSVMNLKSQEKSWMLTPPPRLPVQIFWCKCDKSYKALLPLCIMGNSDCQDSESRIKWRRCFQSGKPFFFFLPKGEEKSVSNV